MSPARPRLGEQPLKLLQAFLPPLLQLLVLASEPQEPLDWDQPAHQLHRAR